MKRSSIVTVSSADIIRAKDGDEELEFALVSEQVDNGTDGGGIHRGGGDGGDQEDRYGTWEDLVEDDLGIEEGERSKKGVAARGA